MVGSDVEGGVLAGGPAASIKGQRTEHVLSSKSHRNTRTKYYSCPHNLSTMKFLSFVVLALAPLLVAADEGSADANTPTICTLHLLSTMMLTGTSLTDDTT